MYVLDTNKDIPAPFLRMTADGCERMFVRNDFAIEVGEPMSIPCSSTPDGAVMTLCSTRVVEAKRIA
jgi:hypothetical protein